MNLEDTTSYIELSLVQYRGDSRGIERPSSLERFIWPKWLPVDKDTALMRSDIHVVDAATGKTKRLIQYRALASVDLLTPQQCNIMISEG